MKITINAPSYKRPDGVDTLKYLPQTKIWVCETEFEIYKKENPKAEIISCKKGVQGNVCRIRNHIIDSEFKSGADAVLIIDDDMQYMGYHFEKKRCRLSSGDVPTFLQKYSLVAKELGAKIWGLNCNQDKQSYREYTPFSMVSYVSSPFTVHLPNPIRYDEKYSLKEDYDLTLQHLDKYRRVLRLNKFFYVVKQAGSGSGQTGGCSLYRNVKKEMDQILALQNKWGPRIVKHDFNQRSHSSKKKKNFDINPVINCPIRGV